MPIDIFPYMYHELFCSIPTRVVPKSEFDWKPIADGRAYPYIPNRFRRINIQSHFFRNHTVDPCDIFYLAEYIPENKDGKRNDYVDTRSRNLILAFKQGKREVIGYVAQKLLRELSPGCVLVAVPPSNVERNGKTAVHSLIHKITSSPMGESLGIVDGSDCLYRTTSIASFHKGGKRSVDLQMDTIGVRNPKLLDNRDVLIIDDILTTGASMTACQMRLRSIVHSSCGFVVGKTIDIENMRFGFILDIDGTLFNTEVGAIKKARVKAMSTKNWDEVIALADSMKPFPGVMELLKKIEASHCDYRLVTSSPKKYAKHLAAILGVEEDHLITYENTVRHKPYTDPYMVAKSQMGIYEPFLIVIGDKMITDLVPAQKLSLSGILLGEKSTEVTFYPDMIDLVDHFDDILETVMSSWLTFSSGYVKKSVTKNNASERVYWESELEKAKKNHKSVSSIEGHTYLIAFSSLYGLKTSDVRIYQDEIIALTHEITAYEKYLSYLSTNKTPVSITEFLDKLYALQEFIDEQLADGVGVLTFHDAAYPAELKKSKDAPLYLFYKGNKDLLHKKSIAVITPKTKEYFPKGTTKNFSRIVSKAGYIIVTGILSECDRAAIEECNYRCVVVLEQPIYRDKNYFDDLKQMVIDKGGCMVSTRLPLELTSQSYKKDAMALKLMLSHGAFVFGYDEYAKDIPLLPKCDYYAMLQTSNKPVAYYQCRSRQLEKIPYMSINDDLDLLYHFKPLTSGEDILSFLKQCES